MDAKDFECVQRTQSRTPRSSGENLNRIMSQFLEKSIDRRQNAVTCVLTAVKFLLQQIRKSGNSGRFVNIAN